MFNVCYITFTIRLSFVCNMFNTYSQCIQYVQYHSHTYTINMSSRNNYLIIEKNNKYKYNLTTLLAIIDVT